MGSRILESGCDPVRASRKELGPSLSGIFPPTPPPDDDLHFGVLLAKTAAEVTGLGQPARSDRADKDSGWRDILEGPRHAPGRQNGADLDPSSGLLQQCA
jgi:hypothetical protein